jgi:hypothetical protein
MQLSPWIELIPMNQIRKAVRDLLFNRAKHTLNPDAEGTDIIGNAWVFRCLLQGFLDS